MENSISMLSEMLKENKEITEIISAILGIIATLLTLFGIMYTFSIFSNSINPISFTLSDNEKKSKFVSGNTVINAIKLFIPMLIILSIGSILVKYIFKKNDLNNAFLFARFLFIFGFFWILYSFKEYFYLIFGDNIIIKKLVKYIKKKYYI